MKINNYNIAMNTQYFNLQKDSLETNIINDDTTFSSDDSIGIKIKNTELLQANTQSNELSMELSKAILKNIDSELNRPLQDRIEMTYSYVEAQALNYQVKAIIETDNRKIELSLDVSLSRSFTYKSSMTIEDLEALKDPLVISLNGGMPSLSTKTFSFDIDSDGKSDQISQLNSGSGFLALDKNNNGKIDNGSELFGTVSGDGFSDLSKYDDDNNGWIDENDAIFDKLRIWQKSEGKDELIALGEVGIGAIFLGSSASPFSLKSNENNLLGELRKSSFVLYENGNAGIISQIDLAVNPKTLQGINTLDDANKTISKLNLDNTYNNTSKEEEEQISEGSNDKRVKIMNEEIKELQSKLMQANKEERVSIQAQIDILLTQIMGLLESQLRL